ncbi:MAG: hypothetical protein HYX63_13555 [Gammaproteobacteria bacterium]|nr:hypothetical protein [Gammaproteobacteria bacterium]
MTPVTVTLNEIEAICGRRDRDRVARPFGGPKQLGLTTPIAVTSVVEILGLFEAQNVLRQINWPNINAARLLAIAIARLGAPIYRRYRPHCGALDQALQAAEKFARGEGSKSTLGTTYLFLQAAAAKIEIPGAVLPPEKAVADATLYACDPFGRPGEMVAGAIEWTDWAINKHDGWGARFDALSRVLSLNETLAFMLRADEAPATVELLAIYHDRIRDICFHGIHTADHRDYAEKAIFPVLMEHLGKDDLQRVSKSPRNVAKE